VYVCKYVWTEAAKVITGAVLVFPLDLLRVLPQVPPLRSFGAPVGMTIFCGAGNQLHFCNEGRLDQPWTFGDVWVLRTTSGAAVVPDTYGLQAGDADDTASFDYYPSFHEASLERPPGGRNALFGEGATHSREAHYPRLERRRVPYDLM
jgi:hypothetical protein